MKMLSLGAVMAVILSAGAPAAGQDACGTAFEKLDRNKDRGLSFEEFCIADFLKQEHLKKLPFADESLFKAGTAPGEEELSRRLFEKADKNKDKKIDRTEWEDFYSTLGL